MLLPIFEAVPLSADAAPRQTVWIKHVADHSFITLTWMLCLQASAWRQSEGAALQPWTGPVDAHRRTFRLREVEAGVARCKALTAPKLRDQVLHVYAVIIPGAWAKVSSSAVMMMLVGVMHTGELVPHLLVAHYRLTAGWQDVMISIDSCSITCLS